MEDKRIILWFRGDLRLHDNEALCDALESGADIYPVYIFDDRVMQGYLPNGIRKTDAFRAQYLLESVTELRQNLRSKGSDLIVRSGLPEQEILMIIKQLGARWVYCNRERTREEVYVQDQLESNLWSIGREVRYSRGKMLYYTADLPWPVTHCPDSFTVFRKEVEKMINIRPPLPTPDTLPSLSDEIKLGKIPSLDDWGFHDSDSVKSPVVRGGELSGLSALQGWIDDVKDQSEFLEPSLVPNSGLSPYLSLGSLSPKYVYQEVMSSCQKSFAYGFYLHLLKRDHRRLMGKKHGDLIFQRGGPAQKEGQLTNDDAALFKIWCEGRTGVPIVDAIMKQLNAEGRISHQSRKIVSRFLIEDLKINWQWGARYFESKLIDYDPCSNWSNWNKVAFVDAFMRDDKRMGTISASKKYDPRGEYIRRWIPALNTVPECYMHEPYLMTSDIQEQAKCLLGRDYPNLCMPVHDLL